MKQLVGRICDYLTWRPEVLAYAGLAILTASVFTGIVFLAST